jgi:hypothetical protein
VLPAVWQPGVPVKPADTIVFGSLIASALLVFVRAFTLGGENGPLREWRDLTRPMGQAKWDFTTSWASTLTAVAAVVTAVVAAQSTIIPNARPR